MWLFNWKENVQRRWAVLLMASLILLQSWELQFLFLTSPVREDVDFLGYSCCVKYSEIEFFIIINNRWKFLRFWCSKLYAVWFQCLYTCFSRKPQSLPVGIRVSHLFLLGGSDVFSPFFLHIFMSHLCIYFNNTTSFTIMTQDYKISKFQFEFQTHL